MVFIGPAAVSGLGLGPMASTRLGSAAHAFDLFVLDLRPMSGGSGFVEAAPPGFPALCGSSRTATLTGVREGRAADSPRDFKAREKTCPILSPPEARS